MRMTVFGRALLSIKAQRDWRIEDMAESVGVSLDAMKQWLYGKRGASSKQAAKIARGLGLEPWHFEQTLVEGRLRDANALTMARVGLATWAASMSEDEWVRFRQEAMRKAG
jgi:transcriptional regulator with XRE-family HTH domain